LTKNEKVDHYIKIKTHKFIALSLRLRVVLIPYTIELRFYWCCITLIKLPL